MMSESIPMPEGLQPMEWVQEAMKRLSNEMECACNHLEVGQRDESGSDFVDALMHLSSMVDGIKLTTQILIEEICTQEERAMVAAMVAQKMYGVPVHVEIVGETIFLVADEIKVPDSLEGINDMDEGVEDE